MDFPPLSFGRVHFPNVGVSGAFFYVDNFDNISCDSVDPDQTPRSAACVRLIWVCTVCLGPKSGH